ncbi:MAG TPA: AMP-binding protein [Burkholderiaceae bacterium]
MQRPWHASYPSGMPREIDPSRYPSVTDLFDEAWQRYGERSFAVCMDRFITYAELERASATFGAWLQSLGLHEGARVAVMLPNVLQFPVVTAAILRAGLVAVPVNPLYTARELEHQLRDSGADVVIVLENFAAVLEQALRAAPVRHVVVCTMGDLLGYAKGALVNFAVRKVKKLVPAFSLPAAVSFREAMAAGRASRFAQVRAAPGDIAFLQYTGGTTGLSKGAILTHRNVVAAMLQFEASFDAVESTLYQDNPTLSPVAQYNVVTALPLYHIYALSACALAAMRRGSLLTLVPNPRDIAGFVKELAKRPFHTFPGLNTLFLALAANEDFRKLDFSQLRLTGAGGMATNPAVAARWKQLTGCVVREGWGMSETCAAGTTNSARIDAHTGTIGLPLPSVDLAVRDENNRDLATGEAGELCIKGPNVTPGYYNRPDETANALTPDGYLRTGDIGTMDERGYFRIVDRKKDMIIVSGFNVFPSEVEAVVGAHPGVLECAAVGVADDETGEAVRLFVVRRDAALDEGAVRDYCRERLTGYKRPKQVVFRDELPKTPVGKVLRRALREPSE